ncbi:MAG TPA: ornithine cyclodeaminase family protein [Synergistaceae bacterium]|nr:ornithine cyclodeaminase family protein [Synergistaceae bacterium]HPJ25422.1 ornithine cyclodeaminase family protein [Synergistaceae bacterium]HPQ37115.1 ornithine cyclodeaminase family protein [Synergistaceae bacterium]
MLWMNKDSMQQALTRNELMDAIEKAYELYERKEFVMPLRPTLELEGDTFMLMPCGTAKTWGIKLLTITPKNPEAGRPMIEGLATLFDKATGAPQAVMDGQALTFLRTGAVGGAAIRRLAPEKARVLGVVGAGVQGLSQALCACAARNIEEVWIADLYESKVEEMAQKLTKELPSLKVYRASSSEEMLDHAEIVITTTTSRKPVLPDNPEKLRGKFYVGIGSYLPEMHEYPDSFFSQGEAFYMDTEHALDETGDLITPLEKKILPREKLYTFGSALKEKVPPYPSGSTVLFKSVGMALFDLVVGAALYEGALAKGLGQELR